MKELLLVLLVIGGVFSAPTTDQCDHLLDVVVVIDGSETISPIEFQIIREVMAQFVDDISVEEQNKHFGVVVYSSDISEVIPLSGDRDTLKSAMQSLGHPRAGTRTDLGLAEMINVFLRGVRPGVPTVGIVITDGASHEHEKTLEQAQRAKAMGIDMFSIGIGSRTIDQELKGIASADNQAFSIEDFSEFAKLIHSLIKDVCPTTTTTVTTTTIPPTPIPTVPVSIPGGPCDGCKMRNGIGYSKHPYCEKFIQCAFNGAGDLIRYYVKTCGVGTFWDQDKVTCEHMNKVNCPNDRCQTKDLKNYRLEGGCAEYVECVNGRSTTSKCRVGYSYSEMDELCLPDASCTSGGQETGNSECHFSKVPNERCHYYWTHGQQMWNMPCPSGTSFRQRDCGCTAAKFRTCRSASACKPLVDIDFNSAEPGEYDNYGAVVKNGLAYFDGYSNIKILRLANVEFRGKFIIKVAYKPYNDSMRPLSQAVVSNGDCGMDASISISNNGHVTNTSLINNQNKKSFIEISSNDLWRQAEYVLEDGNLAGIVNERSTAATQYEGSVLRSQCAFQLGHEEGLQDFKGWIDYIIVSRC